LIEIRNLKDRGVEFSVATVKSKRTFGKQIVTVAEYFNKDFSDFYLYRFAEFFDARTFPLMSDEGVERVIDGLEVRYIFNFTLLFSHFILRAVVHCDEEK
jgi:hypothetical protein